MVDRDQEEKATPATSDMAMKKKELLSTALKRTSEWYMFLNFQNSFFGVSAFINMVKT